MDNEQKAKDLANKHLEKQGVILPIRFNRRIYKGFLNAISEALNIHSVVVPKGTLCEHDYLEINSSVRYMECSKCGDVLV